MKNYFMRPNEPTVKDFYKDRYQSSTIAWVDDYGCNDSGHQYLIFSNTVFYPNGGGQKGDRGIIRLTDEICGKSGLPKDISIVDTRKDGDFIRHYISTGLDFEALEKYVVGSQKFGIEIDWEFRYRQMRLHTIAHLLHCFIEKVLGKDVEYPNYSELQESYGVNRYPFADLLSNEQFDKVIELQTSWMVGNHDIKIYANEDPKYPEWFRWWECGEWKIPCGGVHPANTKEIGSFIADMKIKKGATSITFRLRESEE